MIRVFDILLSLIAITMLSPILIPTIVALKFTGEGEIFYLQERVGKNGKLFKLLKFATMLKNSPDLETGYVTIKNDPRVLPLGRFLRKYKINELPQLFNILLGEMSLIGPRPQTSRCFHVFPENLRENILKLKPGLSGIGPIIFRDEEDILSDNNGNLNFYDNVIAPYKAEVEVWYADKQTLWMYFVLIFLTLWVVSFSKSNIVWRLFKTLPEPPDNLKKVLNYYGK